MLEPIASEDTNMRQALTDLRSPLEPEDGVAGVEIVPVGGHHVAEALLVTQVVAAHSHVRVAAAHVVSETRRRRLTDGLHP